MHFIKPINVLGALKDWDVLPVFETEEDYESYCNKHFSNHWRYPIAQFDKENYTLQKNPQHYKQVYLVPINDYDQFERVTSDKVMIYRGRPEIITNVWQGDGLHKITTWFSLNFGL